MQYLDSAPVLSPAQPAAASTSHSTPHAHQQTQHMPQGQFLHSAYYAESPGPNTTPYRVQNQLDSPVANGAHTIGAANQQPDEVLSRPAEDCMFENHDSEASMLANGTSTSGRQQGDNMAHVTGPSNLSNGHVSQHHGEDNSRRSVIKRLAAKRMALSGFGSPASAFPSPSSNGVGPGAASPTQTVSRGVYDWS